MNIYEDIFYYIRKNGLEKPDLIAYKSDDKQVSWKYCYTMVSKIINTLSNHYGINNKTTVTINYDDTLECIFILLALLNVSKNVLILEKNNIIENNGICILPNDNVINWFEIIELSQNQQTYDLLETNSANVLLKTSGTSGVEKTVCLSQEALINYADVILSALHIDESDCACLVTSLHHTLSVGTFVLSLKCGIPIYIAKNIQYKNVAFHIDKYKCTVLNAVPTYFLGLAKIKTNNNLASLKKGLIAGAPYSESQYNYVTNKLDMKLLPTYGMTECCSITAFDLYDTKNITTSVGKIAQGVEVSIQEKNGVSVADGEVGEICVKSDYLMLYYIEDKCCPLDNGWFHTGDKGYILDDYLFIVGRTKDIIISGGNNIIPSKIQNAILAYKGINECVVIGIPDDYLGEVPVAIITIDKDYDYKVYEYLIKTLNKNEIPKIIKIVNEVPKNQNGKYNKEAIKKFFDSFSEYMLVEPNTKHKESWISYKNQLTVNGEKLIPDIINQDSYEKFLEVVKSFAEGKNLPQNCVPSKTLFLVKKTEPTNIVGITDIRFGHSDKISNFAGNGEGSILPLERGNGLGSVMVYLSKRYSKEKGLINAIITCKEDNIISQNMIRQSGGIFIGDYVRNDVRYYRFEMII